MQSVFSLSEALAFATKHPVVWLATSVANTPHVRGMWMWFADETGFYFHTGSMKRLGQQLLENPRVEIAFHDPGQGRGDGSMMRVSGAVEILDDPALQARLVAERTWLIAECERNPGTTLVIFRIPHGEIQRWSMAVNCRERDQPVLSF
jgi:uncharacterized pyridoxamine 5'-phosphate oxidase family protein